MRSIRSMVSRAAVRRESPAPQDVPLVETAERGAGQLTPADRAFLTALDHRLRDVEHPTVAILGRARKGWLPRVLRTTYPGARVIRLNVTAIDRSDLHARLAAKGPFDVIIEDTRRGRARIRRFRDVFFHLRAGGFFVFRNIASRSAVDDKARTPASDVAMLAQTLDRWKWGSDSEQYDHPEPDDITLADSVASAVVEARHAVFEKRGAALAKLREHEMDKVLELRPELGRVLEQRPPVQFSSRCILHLSSGERARNMRETYDAPTIALREYVEVVCAPGQLVTRDNLLYPDTFRHNQNRRLKNQNTADLAPRFAIPRDPEQLAAPEALAGPHYYLDCEFRGHFGHAMTDVLSRLWAWPAAKQAEPRLKALMAVNRGREVAGWEIALFAAAGIDPDDIVLARGPVRVETLSAPTPMFSMPAYVHPDIAETWARVGRELAGQVPDRTYAKRVFCSRREDKRRCHNSAEVEALFDSRGFHVIYPEDFSLPEQAMIFRQAEVVAGYAGSGLFSLAFCESPKRVIMLSPESYTARNEYMIAAVLGHELDIVLSKPDPSYTGHYWHSGFTFDFDREGTYLEDVLSSL